MKTKFKSLVITIIFCIIFIFIYKICVNIWIEKNNENFEIEEYTYTSDEIMNMKKDQSERIIINGKDMTDVYKEIDEINK